jgi:hypothetical protein
MTPSSMFIDNNTTNYPVPPIHQRQNKDIIASKSNEEEHERLNCLPQVDCRNL